MEDNPEVEAGLYCLMASGVILAVIGFCGCCSSVCENDIMLVFFFIVILVVFIVQIMGFAFACSKYPRFNENMKTTMNFVNVRYVDLSGAETNESQRALIRTYLESIEGKVTNQTKRMYTLAWVKLQDKFHCCGYEGPDDWLKNEEIKAPAWAAYCTEGAFSDLTSANSFTRRREARNMEDEITSTQEQMDDLSKKETFKYGCKATLVTKAATMLVAIFITVMIIELIIIALNARLIHKLRLRNEAAKRAKVHTESVEDEDE